MNASFRVSLVVAAMLTPGSIGGGCCCRRQPEHPEEPLPRLPSTERLRADPGGPLILAVEGRAGLFAAFFAPPTKVERTGTLSVLEPSDGELGRLALELSGSSDGALHVSLPEPIERPCREPPPAVRARLVRVGPSGLELVSQRVHGRELDARIGASGTYAVRDVRSIGIDVDAVRAALPTEGGLAHGAEAIEILQLSGRDALAAELLTELATAAEARVDEALDSLAEGKDCIENVTDAAEALALAQQLGAVVDPSAGEAIAGAIEACPFVGEIDWDARVVAVVAGRIVDQWFDFQPPVLFHKPARSLALGGTTRTRTRFGLTVASDDLTLELWLDEQHDNRVVGTVERTQVDIERIIVSGMTGTVGMKGHGPQGEVVGFDVDLDETSSSEMGNTLGVAGTSYGVPWIPTFSFEAEVSAPHQGLRLPLVPFDAVVEHFWGSGMHVVRTRRVTIHDEAGFDCEDGNPCTKDRFNAAASSCTHEPWTGSLDQDPFDCTQVHCVDGELREELDRSQVKEDAPGNCHAIRCDDWGEPYGTYDAGDPPAGPPPDLPGYLCGCDDQVSELVCRKGDDFIVIEPE